MADQNGPLARLEHELGGSAPSSVRSLGPEHVEHLATAIAQARQRQTAAIAQAGERGLRFVPRLLRGPIRKALGG